jgi:hypothetical protein
MKQIWKYDLEARMSQHIFVGDREAKILKVAEQGDKLRMWVLLDTTCVVTGDTFLLIEIYGTGQPCSTTMPHIDTVFTQKGFVWHVFGEVTYES